jgi:hypothetical protein
MFALSIDFDLELIKKQAHEEEKRRQERPKRKVTAKATAKAKEAQPSEQGETGEETS